jgi:hypothetical protein
MPLKKRRKVFIYNYLISLYNAENIILTFKKTNFL